MQSDRTAGDLAAKVALLVFIGVVLWDPEPGRLIVEIPVEDRLPSVTLAILLLTLVFSSWITELVDRTVTGNLHVSDVVNVVLAVIIVLVGAWLFLVGWRSPAVYAHFVVAVLAGAVGARGVRQSEE